jgi:putative redox protein
MARAVSTRLGAEDFPVEANNGAITWTIDEPVAKGGLDQGPSPTEALLGALGACMAITAKIYARHKGWDLREVQVNLRIEGQEPGGAPHILLRVALEGDLDAEQRARIAKIAGRCPVSRLVSGEVRISEEAI